MLRKAVRYRGSAFGTLLMIRKHRRKKKKPRRHRSRSRSRQSKSRQKPKTKYKNSKKKTKLIRKQCQTQKKKRQRKRQQKQRRRKLRTLVVPVSTRDVFSQLFCKYNVQLTKQGEAVPVATSPDKDLSIINMTENSCVSRSSFITQHFADEKGHSAAWVISIRSDRLQAFCERLSACWTRNINLLPGTEGDKIDLAAWSQAGYLAPLSSLSHLSAPKKQQHKKKPRRSPTEIKYKIPARLKLHPETPLRRGQLGCLHSHWRAWKMAYDRNVPYALIFEDDVNLQYTPTLDAWLDEILTSAKMIPSWDVLYLGYGKGAQSPGITLCAGTIPPNPLPSSYQFVPARGCCGLFAYVIRRQGLASLLQHSQIFSVPADVLLEFLTDLGYLNCMLVHPCVCYVVNVVSDTIGLR
jgi:hypothetical protein